MHAFAGKVAAFIYAVLGWGYGTTTEILFSSLYFFVQGKHLKDDVFSVITFSKVARLSVFQYLTLIHSEIFHQLLDGLS